MCMTCLYPARWLLFFTPVCREKMSCRLSEVCVSCRLICLPSDFRPVAGGRVEAHARRARTQKQVNTANVRLSTHSRCRCHRLPLRSQLWLPLRLRLRLWRRHWLRLRLRHRRWLLRRWLGLGRSRRLGLGFGLGLGRGRGCRRRRRRGRRRGRRHRLRLVLLLVTDDDVLLALGGGGHLGRVS